jgi:hypothetical protein
MKRKMLSIAAAALFAMNGAGIAQTSSSGGSDAPPKILEDPKTMEPFFTDSSMATMRTDEEAKAAFNKLPAEQQEQMKSECKTTTSEKYKDFCAKLMAM